MRGLKLINPEARKKALDVASFTDAWIETLIKKLLRVVLMSHLLQMRGLKLIGFRRLVALRKSHLLQMRGLKRDCCQCWIIETLSHLLQMRGLKLPANPGAPAYITSHLLQMRGLKPRLTISTNMSTCRIFYRCVD